MKQFAIQTPAADMSIDDMSAARSIIGGWYYHRPDDSSPYLCVYNPPDLDAGQAWFTTNGWAALPHVLDQVSQIGADAAASLLHHAPDVLATDTTAAAMTKVVKATGMTCYNPWS